MKTVYGIFYLYDGEPREYTKDLMDLDTAKRMLNLWLSRYWDEKTNKGKAYPNGKGFYPVTKAQIVKVA